MLTATHLGEKLTVEAAASAALIGDRLSRLNGDQIAVRVSGHVTPTTNFAVIVRQRRGAGFRVSTSEPR